MADDSSKPAIPAWQRAQQQQPLKEETSNDSTKEEKPATPPSESKTPGEVEIPTPAEPPAVAAAEEMSSQDTTSSSQLDHMTTFLEDPAVQNAPTEKKRAFFESKGIPKEQIDQVLAAEEAESSFKLNDFESFKQTQSQSQSKAPPPPQQSTQPPQRMQQPQASGPPIITYPEFLVDAHKPPPLITPSRIVNTAYIASGLAALVYGASKFLVAPMADTLTDARHDLLTHSASKVDEMNEKLGGMVSKIPTPKQQDKENEDEEEDSESETSDPTELYHRDMGTQTSPPPSRRASLTTSKDKEKNAQDHENNVLQILNSHLTDLQTQTSHLETSNKERQDAVDKLRQYLEGLMYASPAMQQGMWGANADVEIAGKEGKDGMADAVEEVKKEIKGVKGVLLSAKRFPGVGAGGVR